MNHNVKFTISTLLLSLLPLAASPASAQTWSPKKAPLMTRWAKTVDPQHPLPDYPRPQLVRSDWMNLNGIWEYQPGESADDALPTGKQLTSKICVPFAVESALSGVMEHHERLWYRRSFTVPAGWKNKQVVLNFGAIDYESEVYVNGKSVGKHKGGYLPFGFDITPYLKGSGPQELIVRVFDPTIKDGQPRGKQTTEPGGIMYTPTTGIWQTVWLEPVQKTFIKDLKIVPDIDKKVVRLTVHAANAVPGAQAFAVISAGGGDSHDRSCQAKCRNSDSDSEPAIMDAGPSFPLRSKSDAE